MALMLAGAQVLRAQPPAAPQPGDPPAYVPTLTFDVASIRETEHPQNSSAWQMALLSQPHKCEFLADALIPKVLVQAAYGFGAYQITGAPDWFESSFWAIDAKCDHDVDERLAKLTDDQARAEKQHMMQALLADRFHLKTHWETKEASGYALVLAKGGSKLQPSKTEAADPAVPNSGPPAPQAANMQSRPDEHGRVMTVTHITPVGIAAMLSAMLRIPVEDHTGLTGRFDFTLDYTYQSSDADAYPPVMEAIQQQLGLELQRTHGQIPVLVIDHIERPTPN